MKPLFVPCMLVVVALLAFSAADAQQPATSPQTAAVSPTSLPLFTAWPFDATEAAQRQDETAKALNIPKAASLDLARGVALKLVLIPAGKFAMGAPKDEKGFQPNEAPQHDVTITHPFYMGVYPVTQQQYQQVAGKNLSQFKAPANPVDMMSWDDSVAFCQAVSKQSGKTVRLPTEAEWEYACRAGTSTAFFFGDDQSKLGDYAWVGANSSKTTHPVGQKKPNPFGLEDIYGNVWQWCADWIGPEYYASSPKDDPQGPASGTFRVLRGGSWPSAPAVCRSASRLQNVGSHQVGKIGSFGFRVVVELPKK